MAQSFGEFTGQPQTNLLTDHTGDEPKPEVLPRPVANTKETVAMWDPDRGGIIDIPKTYAEHLKQVGWKFPDGSAPIMGEEAVQQEASDAGTSGAVHLAAHNYLNSLLWGVPQLAKVGINNVGYKHISKTLFESPEELQKDDEHRRHLEELHPIVGTVSDLAGYISPFGIEAMVSKGLIKLGAHGIVEAGAKALEDKAFAKAVASGYGSQAVKGYIGKAGAAGVGVTNAAIHALKGATEFGARGGIEEATQEKTYDHQIDAERVFTAAKDDFGWGLEMEAGIQGLFGGLRLARLGGSKTVDAVQKRWPGKWVNVPGTKVLGPEELKSRTIRYAKVKTNFGKINTKTYTGGGFEEGSTHAKNNFFQDTLENTKAKASFVNKDETLGETRTRRPDTFKQERSYKEPMPEFADEEAVQPKNPLKRETGIVWEKGATHEERLVGAKQGLDDLTSATDDGKIAMKEVIHNEDTIANLMKKKETAGFLEKEDVDALHKAKQSKVFWTEFLEKEFPETEDKLGYRNWKDEYYNVMNKLHDEVTEKQLKKDPRFKTRTIKETTEKGSEESSYENTHKYDYKDGEDETKTRKKTKEVKVDEDKSRFHKKIEAKTAEKNEGADTYEYAPFESVRYAPSRLKEQKWEYKPIVRDGIRTPIMVAAGALGFLTGGAAGLTVHAGQALALDTAIPALLNNRAKVSRVFDKAMKNTAKAAAGTLRAYEKKSTVDAHEKVLPVNVAQYDKAVENVTNNLNPSLAKENVIKGMGEHVAAEKPVLTQNLIRMNTDAAHMLAPHIVKDTRAPSLRQTPFNPPRSQKVKFLKLYHAATNPLEAMKNPSPAQMEIISQLHPMHHRIFTSAISGMLVANPDRIDNKKQRELSIAMGSNFTARQDPGYLKRQQMTAHIDETPKGGGGGASHSGPKSAKVTANAVNIDATPLQLNQLA